MTNQNGTELRQPGAGGLSRRALLGKGATALAATLAALPGAAAASPAAGLRLRRGGSIHTLLNWPQLATGSPAQIAWPPFTAAKYQIAPALLKDFRRAGLDFIRLTIDPGLLLATSGEQRKQALAIIAERCRMLNTHGFSVIADFHPIYQIPAFAPERLITDAALFERFTRALADTAQMLRAFAPERVALEVFNEPPFGYDSHTVLRWTAMLHTMHRAIRAEHPHLSLVLSGAASGGVRGLLHIDARKFSDPNIYWSFHFYDPHLFTHQGVATSQENMLWFRYLTDLPYPARRGNPALTMEALRQTLQLDTSVNPVARNKMEKEAQAAVASYFAQEHSRRTIAAEFARVRSWAAANAVPAHKILLGEFGAARRNPQGNGASETHRLEWLRDVRLEAEANNFAWALWDINAPQMGFMKANNVTMDAAVLAALGLEMPA